MTIVNYDTPSFCFFITYKLKIMNYYELVSLTFFSYFCKKIAALLHKNKNRLTKVPPLT